MKNSLMSETNEGFGIYDTKDNSWIGDNDGAWVYKEEVIAQIGARVMDYRLGLPAGQLRAKPMDPGVKTKKCDVEAKMSAEKALELLEGGAVI